MRNIDELRIRIETEFEERIPSALWEAFLRDFETELAEVEHDHGGFTDDAALAQVSILLRAYRKGRRRTPLGSGKVDEPREDHRGEALAAILAIRARRDPDVMDIRHDLLDDKPIELADVPAWIQKTAEADGPSTGLVPDHDTDYRQEGSVLIRYVHDYHSNRTLSHPIRLGGQLWRLRGAARRISHGFGWPEAWMVTFILTDVAPTAPLRFGWTIHREDVPALDSIELRLNPYSVSPRELEQAYRKLRTRTVGRTRVDKVTVKGRDLAIHWEETRGQPTGTRRVQWNTAHPNGQYSEPTGNFGRDATAAHRQVTGEDETQ